MSDLESRLRALYAEADALFGGWSCPGRAECCQFGVTGRQPELWPIEWRLLQRALKARPAPRRAESREGDCPAFDPATRRCRAYEDRPFGCRTHFCDEAEGDQNPRKEVRELARRLSALAEDADHGGKLAPLLSWSSKRR